MELYIQVVFSTKSLASGNLYVYTVFVEFEKEINMNLTHPLAYNNYTPDELLRAAENENNTVALSLYEAGKKAAEKELEAIVEELPDPEDVADTINHIYTAEWNKLDAVPVVYSLDGFNESHNVHHHDVRIESNGRNKWTVRIAYGSYGETVTHSTIAGSLAEAKAAALKLATELAAKGELKW